MNARAINAAAGVILAAVAQNRLPAGIALALDAAGLLQSPETEQRTLLAGELTPEQRRDASRYTLRHARNRDDLRELLNMLGLNPPPRPEQ